MTRINVLNELTTAEKLNLHDHIQQDEFDALAFDLRDNPHALALVLFLWDTGVRATEAANLRLGWVTPADNCAIVKYRGLVRIVRYGDYCAKALTNWLTIRPKTENNARVFINPLTYEGFNRQRLTKYFGQLLYSLRDNVDIDGLEFARPGLNIHSFRTSFALRIVGTTPPRAMRYMLGLHGAGNAPLVFGDDIKDGFLMSSARPKKFLTPAEVLALISANK